MAKYDKKIVESKLTADYKQFKNSDFKNEKELLEYILLNKEVFCEEVLGIKYKNHIVENPFRPIEFLHDNTPNVDLVFIDSEDYIHMIELKCPHNAYGENLMGLGQCLSYYYLSRVNNLRLADVYLVTTKHNNLIPLVINDNDLKIKYIYFDKSKHAVLYK